MRSPYCAHEAVRARPAALRRATWSERSQIPSVGAGPHRMNVGSVLVRLAGIAIKFAIAPADAGTVVGARSGTRTAYARRIRLAASLLVVEVAISDGRLWTLQAREPTACCAAARVGVARGAACPSRTSRAPRAAGPRVTPATRRRGVVTATKWCKERTSQDEPQRAADLKRCSSLMLFHAHLVLAERKHRSRQSRRSPALT
jgi:hypothetical protein